MSGVDKTLRVTKQTQGVGDAHGSRVIDGEILVQDVQGETFDWVDAIVADICNKKITIIK
jgi:hypothetical protein